MTKAVTEKSMSGLLHLSRRDFVASLSAGSLVLAFRMPDSQEITSFSQVNYDGMCYEQRCFDEV